MHLWSFINEINEYIQHSAPWKEADPDTLSNLLYTLAESLRHIALFLFPFMPDTAEKIWDQLNLRGSVSSSNLADEVQWGKTEYGIKIKKGPALFPRIDTGKKGNR
jgi:methionyl-tRNA synthetase